MQSTRSGFSSEEQNVHLEEKFQDIRGYWEIPHVSLFLFMMQRPLRLKKFSINDFELAVITPERSKFAQEFMTKLLLWTGEPKSLLMLSKGEGYECAWWNARLRDRVAGWFADREREAKLLQILNREGAEVDEGDGTQDIQIFILEQTRLYAGKLPSEEKLERSLALWDITLSPLGQTNPLQDCNFTDLGLKMRVLVIKALCDWHLYKSDHKCESLREYTNDDLRVEKYAEDKQYVFFQFPQFWEECRLYRSSKKTRKWECCCANFEELEKFSKGLKKTRKNKQFRNDLKDLIEELQEEQERLERDRIKKEKLRALMAQPRRISSRLEVKMKQQMEQERLRLEAEKVRRAEKLERARKKAELEAIRQQKRQMQTMQMVEAQKKEEEERRQQARDEGKRQRETREKRRDEMRKRLEAQKRAKQMQQQEEQKIKAEQKRLLREYRLKKRLLRIEGGEELANTLKPPDFLVEMQSQKVPLSKSALPKKRQRRRNSTTPLHRCVAVWHKLYQSKFAGAFLEPVNTDMYPSYLDLIDTPMDLGTIGKKLKTGTYLCVEDFVYDMRLVFNNCMTFNLNGSKIHKFASKLLGTFERYLKSWIFSSRSSGLWVKELNKNLWADEIYGNVDEREDEPPSAARSRVEGRSSVKEPAPQSSQPSTNSEATPVEKMTQSAPELAKDVVTSGSEATHENPSSSSVSKDFDSTNQLHAMEACEDTVHEITQQQPQDQSKALTPPRQSTSSPDAREACAASSDKVITWDALSILKQSPDRYERLAAIALASSSARVARAEDSVNAQVMAPHTDRNHLSSAASHASDSSRSRPAAAAAALSQDLWQKAPDIMTNSVAHSTEGSPSLSGTLEVVATVDHPHYGFGAEVNQINIASGGAQLPFHGNRSLSGAALARVSMLQQRPITRTDMQPTYSSLLAGLGQPSPDFRGMASRASQNALHAVPRGLGWDPYVVSQQPGVESQNPYFG